MNIETIDGTIETATVKQANAKVSIYEAIAFRLADGSERRLEKVAVAPAVAEILQPGVQGRFYAYSAIDHKGLVAARSKDGRSAYAIPSGNERIMLMAAIVGAVWFAVVLITRGDVALLSLVLAVGGGFGFFSYRSTRLQSRARYDADGR
jgi:hypothetical protein